MANSFRFLNEYANHKKRQAKIYCKSKESLHETVERIDKILFMVHRGHIILDEAMRLLSEVET